MAIYLIPAEKTCTKINTFFPCTDNHIAVNNQHFLKIFFLLKDVIERPETAEKHERKATVAII